MSLYVLEPMTKNNFMMVEQDMSRVYVTGMLLSVVYITCNRYMLFHKPLSYELTLCQVVVKLWLTVVMKGGNVLHQVLCQSLPSEQPHLPPEPQYH